MGGKNFTDWTISLELKSLTVFIESNLIFFCLVRKMSQNCLKKVNLTAITIYEYTNYSIDKLILLVPWEF